MPVKRICLTTIAFLIAIFMISGCANSNESGSIESDTNDMNNQDYVPTDENELLQDESLSSFFSDLLENPPLGRILIGPDGNIQTPDTVDSATKEYLQGYSILEIASVDVVIFQDKSDLDQYLTFVNGEDVESPESKLLNGYIGRFGSPNLMKEYDGEYFVGTDKYKSTVDIEGVTVLKYTYKQEHLPDENIVAYVLVGKSHFFQFNGVRSSEEDDIINLMKHLIQQNY